MRLENPPFSLCNNLFGKYNLDANLNICSVAMDPLIKVLLRFGQEIECLDCNKLS